MYKALDNSLPLHQDFIIDKIQMASQIEIDMDFELIGTTFCSCSSLQFLLLRSLFRHDPHS